MAFYPAFIHYEEGHAHSVFFPDVTGCFSAGDTLEETFVNAKQALSFHFEGLREDGLPIPQPSSLDALKANGEYEDDFANATLIRVPLVETHAKPKRVNISLTPSLLNAIDQAAKEQGMTRSAFLASAALQRLG